MRQKNANAKLPLRELPVREFVAHVTRVLRRRRREGAANVSSALRTSPSRHLVRASAGAASSSKLNGLHWQQGEQLQCCEVSADGRLLTRMAGPAAPWAVGSLLPVAGKVSFVVRVEAMRRPDGISCIGVADGSGNTAWGLMLQSGRLFRCTRDASGSIDLSGHSPAPSGFPDGHGAKVLLQPIAQLVGAAVEVIVEPDEGKLYVCVNGAAPLLALRGLPRGTALRPWARLAHPGDRVSLDANWRASSASVMLPCVKPRGPPGRRIV